MEIKKILYKKGCTISYSISDNICNICAHNPLRFNIHNKYLDGKCNHENRKNVVECYDFAKYGSEDSKPIIGYSRLNDIKE